jgi:hypothetical protein
MIKADEVAALKRGEGCLGKSADDEPVFVLVARDRTSSKTVRQWVQNARDAGCQNEEKLDEALRLAVQMDQWREAHGGGKVPD